MLVALVVFYLLGKFCLHEGNQYRKERVILPESLIINIDYSKLTNMSEEKVKKYDYLNKYNQHEMLQRTYQEEVNRCRVSPNSVSRYKNIINTSDSPQEKQQVSEFKNEQLITRNQLKHQFRECLSHQITQQNALLSEQVKEYRILVSKLERELGNCKEQCNVLKEQINSDQLYYDQAIKELQNQNSTIKYKYKILDAQLMQLTKTKQENQQLRERLSHSTKSISQFQQQFKAYLSQLSHTINNSEQPQLNSFQLVDSIRQIIKKKKKLQDFVNNITQMHSKIENNSNGNDLKVVWKWLKQVGSQYSYMNKVRPLLINKLHIQQYAQIQQIVQYVLYYG